MGEPVQAPVHGLCSLSNFSFLPASMTHSPTTLPYHCPVSNYSPFRNTLQIPSFAFSLFPFTRTHMPYAAAGPPSNMCWEQTLALKYLHQKSLQCTSEVSLSSGRDNENHWQATYLLFLWGTVPDLWLLTSTCKDDMEWLRIHLHRCLSAFPLPSQPRAEASLQTPGTAVWAAI